MRVVMIKNGVFIMDLIMIRLRVTTRVMMAHNG